MNLTNPIFNKMKTDVLGDNLAILVFGSTGSGKTPMIGELAEEYFKLYKRKTRLAAADKGGWDSIRPYVELGIIQLEPMTGDPWVWWNNVIQGKVWRGGKWVEALDPEIALYAFEGMTTLADEVMKWMSTESGKGKAIGGPSAGNFTVGSGVDSIKIGNNNMTHYKIAQNYVYEMVTRSQYLPGTTLWTAGDSRADDESVGGVVGPQTAGRAQTPEIPRWFNRTFHIVAEVQPMQAVKHILYMDQHIELQSKGMAKAFTNSRIPLAGGEATPIPVSIEPASLVKALELLQQRQGSAKDEIAKRLGLA